MRIRAGLHAIHKSFRMERTIPGIQVGWTIVSVGVKVFVTKYGVLLSVRRRLVRVVWKRAGGVGRRRELGFVRNGDVDIKGACEIEIVYGEVEHVANAAKGI